METPKYLRRVDAAAYIREKYSLPCATGYLEFLACNGGGPAFRRIGRWPVYEHADLDAWARSRMTPKVRSNAQLRSAA